MPKPFSMIREFHLADWFTLGNAVSGMGALFSAMTFVGNGNVLHVQLACALIFLALVFDVLDGRIARWRKKSSELGRELDSLADVVSFGVAPAVLAYACGMNGLWDRILLAYFVACGVSRLARYNVTAEAFADEGGGKVKYFEGTPIPTSFLLVVVLTAVATYGAVGDTLALGSVRLAGFDLHFFSLLFGLSGSLMISRIHVPKP
jgi:CDP-diacylglycerol---serine O-phosphatidyltransferase